MATPLPKISSVASQLPDCCLSISTKLLDILIQEVLSSSGHKLRTGTILSIGSGSGLLEALLLDRLQAENIATNDIVNAGTLGKRDLSVIGVEVYQAEGDPINKYLPEQAVATVRGTYSLSPLVSEGGVCALLFVYPRQKRLVAEYVEQVVKGKTSCDVILWLGPLADWTEFESCLKGSSAESGVILNEPTVISGEDSGLAEYELLAVTRVLKS
jgi:hypothetical protein